MGRNAAKPLILSEIRQLSGISAFYGTGNERYASAVQGNKRNSKQKELHKVTDRGSLLRLSLKIDNGYFYLFLSPELAVTP
jgi:hypothetical protein